ncbi:hypothetical protein J1N35_015111 [Gossypium stocksii]|uniref:Uncharacterized protein n=1 Tax=Gossypium stocksii TaxID=47602 RepID=A0A9D3VWB0_9ROSI|nr:hypothetical protein J1N35_015111 [Gossypium stocksii]
MLRTTVARGWFFLFLQVKTTQQTTPEENTDGVGPKDMIVLGTVLAMYSSGDDKEEEVYRPAHLDATLDAPLVGTGTFNLHSCLKAGTVVYTRGLLGGERLLWCSKGDAPFRAMIVVVITQPINNYNHCHANSSLTSTVPEHFPLLLRALLFPLRCLSLERELKKP